MLSFTEENYLKALLHLSWQNDGLAGAGTNELAAILNLKPATVNDMLKKLKQKKLVDYHKYGKIFLTKTGQAKAVEVIRKHRLWETFLFEKLGFAWDEVHELAEQLEHIQSPKLIDRLDAFLGYPQTDPHGESIPNAKGVVQKQSSILLSEAPMDKSLMMTGVKDDSKVFLQYVMKIGLSISDKFSVSHREAFDDSMELLINGKKVNVTQQFSQNVLVRVV